jgi:hypothetical protein
MHWTGLTTPSSLITPTLKFFRLPDHDSYPSPLPPLSTSRHGSGSKEVSSFQLWADRAIRMNSSISLRERLRGPIQPLIRAREVPPDRPPRDPSRGRRLEVVLNPHRPLLVVSQDIVNSQSRGWLETLHSSCPRGDSQSSWISDTTPYIRSYAECAPLHGYNRPFSTGTTARCTISIMWVAGRTVLM